MGNKRGFYHLLPIKNTAMGPQPALETVESVENIEDEVISERSYKFVNLSQNMEMQSSSPR